MYQYEYIYVFDSYRVIVGDIADLAYVTRQQRAEKLFAN